MSADDNKQRTAQYNTEWCFNNCKGRRHQGAWHSYVVLQIKTRDTIWYDTIEEFNVDSKAEYTA